MVLQSVQRIRVRCACKGILSRNMERRLVVRIRNRVIPWLRNVQLCIPVEVKLFFKRKKTIMKMAPSRAYSVTCHLLTTFHIHCLHSRKVSNERKGPEIAIYTIDREGGGGHWTLLLQSYAKLLCLNICNSFQLKK